MPGANEVEVCLFWIRSLQLVPFGHVAVGDAHEPGRPLILVARVNGLEGLAHVVRVKTDERIAADFRAMNRLNLDFVESPFRMLLAERKRSQNQNCRSGDEKNLCDPPGAASVPS